MSSSSHCLFVFTQKEVTELTWDHLNSFLTNFRQHLTPCCSTVVLPTLTMWNQILLIFSNILLMGNITQYFSFDFPSLLFVVKLSNSFANLSVLLNHVTWLVNRGQGSYSQKSWCTCGPGLVLFNHGQLVYVCNNAPCESARCRHRFCPQSRASDGTGSILAVSDWISGWAWWSALIECPGGGSLTMHNYFHCSDNKWAWRGISGHPT